MSVADILIIIAISAATAVGSELVSYYMIYGTESYKRLNIDINRLTRRADKMEVKSTSTGKKSYDKKKGTAKSDLTDKTREMSLFKLKSTLVLGVAMFGVFSLLGSIFEDRPVAKLPFTPFGLLGTLSHRGITNNDMRLSSYTFIYVLCSFSLRTCIQKFMNLVPKEAAGKGFFESFEEEQEKADAS